ncbi:MAG: CotH kinase family protein [Lentimicrobiaceae bacterium]|nr:CotH kinase family protein [Lentimicrobiaceae bacterium]
MISVKMNRNFFITLAFTLIFVINANGQNQVKEYFISCNPDDFAYIYANYSQDIYIPITLTYNGTTWNNVQMRIRGDGSRSLPKKSLKVKLNHTPFANGRFELNFNAEYEDQSYIRAFVSSLVFRQAGLACFQTEFVRLYLNGNFLGLYNYTENVDEQFLEAHNYDSNGNLYKAAEDGSCLSIYDDITNFWEQKTGSGNKEDLVAFINQINNVSDANYLQFCEDRMNYSQMINIIACNMITSNQSTYYHNYFMYHDVNGSNKWEMMPWDLDKTLSVQSWRNYTNSSANWVHDNPFLERALLNPTIFSDIQNRVREIGNQIFTTNNLWQKIDSVVLAIQPSVEEDVTDDIENVQQWLGEVTIEKNHIANWLAQLQWQFAHVQSSFVATRTPGYHGSDVTFHWTPSVDPDGGFVFYRFSITTNIFEPETTTVYDSISDTTFTLTNLAEGNYFWRVSSIKDNQEVAGFDSRNPLIVKNLTTLPCSITENTVLSVENSPYRVSCNVTVEPQAVLTIPAGVSLLFDDNMFLDVKGGLEVSGTKDNPVHFKPYNVGSTFDSLVFTSPTQNIHLNYLYLTDAAIHAHTANITWNHCKVLLENKHLVGENVIYRHYYGNVEIYNSTFNGNRHGQGLEFGYCQSAIVENCNISNFSDPVEYMSVAEGYIKNNILKNSYDDGIYFDNGDNIVIEGNKIFNCSDNGISLGNEFFGTSDNVILRKNLIVGCTTGITVQNGSSATCDGNTLYSNNTDVKLRENNAGLGGGHLDIVNTIFASTINNVFDVDDTSQFTISYSLCNTENIEGTGNLFAEPLFVSPADSNFQLLTESLCINAGNPASPADPDGTRADMGAFFYNLGIRNVVFNEINYKSANDFDTGDWVELYNADDNAADISGWIFKDEDDAHTFEIPYGTILQPDGYLILCADLPLFRLQYPDMENAIGDFSFGLSSNGELIRLYNQTGTLVDSVVYGIQSPWPTEPNGHGSTLELKNPSYDNTRGENWCSSSNHGTPGQMSSCFVHRIDEVNNLPFEIKVFPNPAATHVSIQFNHFSGGNLSIQLFTATGDQIFEAEKSFNGSGKTLFELNQLPAKGMYLLRATFTNKGISYSESVKFIVY